MAKGSNLAVAEVKNGAVYILQAGTPVYVKTADICAITSKSNQWIGQLTSQGTLSKSKTPHGSMYELAPTMKAYCDMLTARSSDKDSKSIEREKLESEVSLKKAKAAIAQIEVRELLGKMHRSEDVAQMTEDLIFTIRSALTALPGRLAVDVSNATSPSEASEIIRKEVNRILNELSTFRYDPSKYAELVNKRSKISAVSDTVMNDEEK